MISSSLVNAGTVVDCLHGIIINSFRRVIVVLVCYRRFSLSWKQLVVSGVTIATLPSLHPTARCISAGAASDRAVTAFPTLQHTAGEG